MKKPHTFGAGRKPFTLQLDYPCLMTGFETHDGKWRGFYRPVPVKKGDQFWVGKDRWTGSEQVFLNGKVLRRAARPARLLPCKISWVAKRLRIAVFKERDRVYSRRLKRFTKKLRPPHWCAVDVRSYHVGCGDTCEKAIQAVLMQAQATNWIAEEARVLEKRRVIRWRCLLPPNEVKEMEAKARKTGFILEGVEPPAPPEEWVRKLEKLRRRHA